MPDPTSALQPVHTAIIEGRPALLLTGRSLRDLDLYPDTARVGPVLEIFRSELRNNYGMVLVTYSRAEGIDFAPDSLDGDADRQRVQEVLRTHHLLDIPQDEQEVAHVLRGVANVCRTPTQGLTWANGQPLRFCLLLDFAEHLIPQCDYGGSTDAQIIAAELAHITASSLALRRSGNLLILHTPDANRIDAIARTPLQEVRLPQPNEAAKLQFIEAICPLYTQAKLADQLGWHQVTKLTANTPNQGLEALIRAAHRTQRPLTTQKLVAQKSADVQAISEQTLTVLDTSRVAPDQQLQGVNSAYPQSILHQFSKALAEGNRLMPANVLLVGPPGTGKTEMSLIMAKQAGVAAYQMHSPKTGIVGETERKAELQQRTLKEWVPNVAFVDEITEALPLERQDFDGDSGASRAVGAALLTALADESRRGQSLLVATTNCPWRMGAAMRSRFVAIPVLQPLAQDYSAIVATLAQQVVQTDTQWLAPDHPAILEAAALFAQKGANPRHVRGALSNALLLKDNLTPETVLFAAQDLSISTDRASTLYSDLWAIKACSSKSFLPWSANLAHYLFPEHLQGLVDVATGDLNLQELDHRIQELKPHANL
jgi:hypothetical protein